MINNISDNCKKKTAMIIQVRMSSPIQSNFPISNFSQIRSKGRHHQISIFSQIQKSPKHPGGGGDQENCGLFPLFVTFFHSEASLKMLLT